MSDNTLSTRRGSIRTSILIIAAELLLLCAMVPDISYAEMTERMGDGELERIGVSYDQVMAYLSKFFSMEKSTPVRGQDRYMGQTTDGTATLEIIGSKRNISQATLMVGLPIDAPKILARNGAMMLRFLMNTVPEWPNSVDWLTAANERLADSPDAPQEIIKGDKVIKLSLIKGTGIVVLTVKLSEQARLRREQERQAQIRAHKGTEYFEAQEYKKAIEQYKAAITMDEKVKADISDKVAKCYYRLGEQYFDQRDYQEAKEYYLLATEYDFSIKAKLKSNLAQCYLAIGDSHFGERNFNKALQNYELARETDYSFKSQVASKVGRTYLAIGDSYFDQRDFDEALQNYKAAKSTDQSLESKVASKLGDTYLAIGKRFESQGRYGDALVLYQNSLQYSPDNGEVKRRIREIDNMRKNPTLRGLLSIVPGMGQLSLGQPEKAFGYFGLAAASAGVSVVYLSKADSKYEEYEKATIWSDAQRLHKETMDNYKTSLAAAGIGACVIVYSIYDAYVGAVAYNQRFKPTSESKRYSINVMPILSERGILLAARMQF